VNRVDVGFSNAEGSGICVGVVNNNAIPAVVKAGATTADGIADAHAVHTGASGAPFSRTSPRCHGGCFRCSNPW